MYEGIEKLLDTMSVCNDCDGLPESEVEAAWLARLMARNELIVYLSNYLGDEPVQCYVTFPFEDIELTVFSEEKTFDSEFIYLPFGWFSCNLWEALKKDRNNLLFKVLRYFSWNATVIVHYLAMDGVDLIDGNIITSEFLNEHAILDIFSLHSYIEVYKDIDKYID